jgi:hypothetical protein
MIAMCQVYSAFKLIFYVSKIMGFAPYTILENGVLMPSRAARRYSIFLCSSVIASELEVFAVRTMTDSPIYTTGFTLISSSSWVTHLLSFVLSVRSHKEFAKITQKLNTLDSMLQQTLYARKKQFYALLAQLVVGFIVLGLYLFWDNFYGDSKAPDVFGVVLKSFNLAVKFICIFGDYIVVLQYLNLVLFIGQHFSHVNVKFVELGHLCSQNPSTARASSSVTFRAVSKITSPKPVGRQLDQVSVLVDIHNKLLDTVRSINSTYSLQILFNVAKMFVTLTFCLYFVLVTFSNDYDPQYKVRSLFICLWSLVHLMLIIASCDYTKRQVSVDYDCCLFCTVLSLTKKS